MKPRLTKNMKHEKRLPCGLQHPVQYNVQAVTSAATAAVKLALAGDGKASPTYRQMVVLALRWATEEVGRYFKPDKPDKTAADQRSPRERREYARIQAKV